MSSCIFIMAKKSTVECKFANCPHETREITNLDDAVKDSHGNYYHKDCYKSKKEISQIIDLFVKHINPHPDYPQLQNTIKTISFKQGYGTEMLLFGLQYYIKNRIPLHYPLGLYYVIKNDKMKEAYYKAKNKAKFGNFKVDIKETTESKFQYVPKKRKGFGDILR